MTQEALTSWAMMHSPSTTEGELAGGELGTRPRAQPELGFVRSSPAGRAAGSLLTIKPEQHAAGPITKDEGVNEEARATKRLTAHASDAARWLPARSREVANPSRLWQSVP